MRKKGVCFRKAAVLLASALLVTGLSACGEGDKGDQGPEGPAGPPGARTEAPESLTATITDVSIDSAPVVELKVEDGNGIAFRGLDEGGRVSFTIAKLVPGSGGETNHWRSYIWHADGGAAGGSTSEIANAQAYNDSDGTLENHGDGTYTYTFATDITDNVQRYNHETGSQETVAYEPDLPHRVGMEIRGSYAGDDLPGADAVYTFKPSSGEVVTAGRKIVARDSCNECHGNLAAHGNGRFQPDYCVTCHQPGSIDVESGNTMDFRVLVHKVHTGENLPSVLGPDGDSGTADDGDYAFCGHGCEHYGSGLTSFAEVAFPQDTRNCTKCHDPAETEATPQATNIVEKPNRAACGSCHDDVDFETGTNHPGGAQSDDSNCSGCHSSGGSVGSVLASHTILTQEYGQRFEYVIHDISNTAPGNTPQVTYSIKYDSNDDGTYDQDLDVLAPDGQVDPANGASVNLNLAWSHQGTTDDEAFFDYTNYDPVAESVTGDAPAEPVSMSLLSDNAANITDNGDGTFTVTSSQAIPASGVTGSGAVAMEGYPAAQYDADGDGTPEWHAHGIAVTSAVEYFAITDTSVQARRQVVDIAKCQGCHGKNDGLAMHGANRNDNVELCVMCHNPNNTDLKMRLADPTTEDDVNSATPDDLEERPIDFKFLIHAVHGADKRSTQLVVYGYRNSSHNFSHLHFPRSSSDCLACHVEGTYQLPLGNGVLGSTLDTGDTVEVANMYGTSDFWLDDNPATGPAWDPTDDGNASPMASVCRACHDSDSAASHMITTGNATLPLYSYGDLQTQSWLDANSVEACATCHGPDRTVSVSKVHGLD